MVVAHLRLRLWGAFPGMYPDATAEQCRAWADDERRLVPLVSPDPMVDLREPLDDRLAGCLKRAAAPRDH